MAVASSMFCYLMVETTLKFVEEKIVLELSSEEIPISAIPFPAVTICPQVHHEEDIFGRKFYAPSDEKLDNFEETSTRQAQLVLIFIPAMHSCISLNLCCRS
jgi:Amiloride-sensitive sodium channel